MFVDFVSDSSEDDLCGKKSKSKNVTTNNEAVIAVKMAPMPSTAGYC